MNTAEKVSADLAEWLASGLLKSEIVVKLAEDCIGWPYVFGAAGELCNQANRKKYYNNYINRNPAEAEQIKKHCPVINGTRSSCSGCSYYPGGTTRCYDCRGFTRWVFGKVSIKIDGAGCTSQWNNAKNWAQKGEIRDMPNVICVVFMQDKKNKRVMSHTGIHVGGGKIIHCSGTVKTGETSDKGWTHYAIPAGMEGGDIPVPTTKPTLRKGSRGEYVTLMQTQLIQQGYSVGSSGADGIFGNDTLYAVKKYQLDHGLQMDGIVGQATWAALDNPQPIALYTIHIPGQPKYAAEAFVKQYAGAWMTEDGDQ